MDPKMERVQYLTTHFNELQGLRFVPIGIFFVLLTARDVNWLPQWPSELTFLIGFPLTFLLYRFLGVYYERAFGRVQPLPSQQSYQLLWFFIWLIVLLLAIVLDVFMHPPVNLFGLTGATIALFYLFTKRRFGWHYSLMGIIATLIALMSVLPTGYTYQRLNLIGLALAILFIIIGISDHRLLVHMMGLFKKTPRDGGPQ